MLRADNGTENSLVAIIQPILRHYHHDTLAGKKSFMYGRSINNQVCHVRLKVILMQYNTFLWLHARRCRELRHCGVIYEDSLQIGG